MQLEACFCLQHAAVVRQEKLGWRIVRIVDVGYAVSIIVAFAFIEIADAIAVPVAAAGPRPERVDDLDQGLGAVVQHRHTVVHHLDFEAIDSARYQRGIEHEALVRVVRGIENARITARPVEGMRIAGICVAHPHRDRDRAEIRRNDPGSDAVHDPPRFTVWSLSVRPESHTSAWSRCSRSAELATRIW